MTQVIIYAVFLLLSAVSVTVALLVAINSTKNRNAPAIIEMIIGVFLAIFFICIPKNFVSGGEYGWADVPRLLFVTIYESIQAFVAGLDFSRISAAYSTLDCKPLVSLYSFVSSVLLVVAPMLTFSAVLSFFRNFIDDLRYFLFKSRPTYIFSELNEYSLAVARSIRDKHMDDNSKIMIIFAGVSFKDENERRELLPDARDIHAVCLQKDVTHLDIISKKSNVEIFLIETDESENVRKAAIITEKLNACGDKRKEVDGTNLNVKVFVFTVNESSRYILDSLDYSNLLNQSALTKDGDNPFKLRRINQLRQLAWNTVPKMDVFDKARDGVISVMIAGMGSQGMEFFKALMWFCQIEGCKLEINLFDKTPKSERGGIESIIGRQCPELIEKNDPKSEYDIQMFDGIDFNTDAFEKLLRGDSDTAKRLRRTDIVIVSFGDDNLNIETAVYLRTLFDRYNNVKKKKDRTLGEEVPDIYSVVYDSKKSGVLCKGGNADYLIDHKEEKYHIRFIGSTDEQYSYDNIYNAEREANAFKYHIGWVNVTLRALEEMKEQVFDKLRSRGYSEGLIRVISESCFGKEAAENGLKSISDSEKKDGFNDLYDYLKREGISDAVELLDTYGFISSLKDLYTDCDNENELMHFNRFEYFRQSSMAMAIHKEYLKKPKIAREITCQNGGDKILCECENCIRRKKMEHARWNAYMRTEGYSYREERFDRAKLHNDLIDWDKLSKWEQAKD